MFKFYILLFCIISLYACNASESSEKFEKEKKIIYKEVEPSQTYESCKIGGQTWMAQNLNEPHFKNGDPITLQMLTAPMRFTSKKMNLTRF